MTATDRKWTSTAGPRQTKAVDEAAKKAAWAGKSRKEINGMIGGEEHTAILTGIYSPVRFEVVEKLAEVGERFGWTITRENCRDVEQAFHLVQRWAEETMPVDDLRKTPDQLRAIEAERQRLAVKQSAEADQHAAAVAEEAARLRAKYPWAASIKSDLSEYAKAAFCIRRELADTFPGVHFSVRSRGFSMGNEVSVDWTLGPTTQQVETITSKYQQGHFDGMNDIYEDDRSAASEAVGLVLGQSKYVITQRGYGDDLYDRVGADLCKLQSVEFNGPYTRHVFGSGDTEDVRTHVYRILQETAFGPDEDYAGLEVKPDDDQDHRQPYRVVKTQPTPAPETPKDDGSGKPTLTRNEEKNGLEIRFPAKPDQTVLDRLKSAGWRWSRFGGCWWHKRTTEAEAFASELTA